MADLQKFDSLLTELRNEAAVLDKRKTDLYQECMTLEARKAYLASSLSDAAKQADTAKSAREAALTKLGADIQALEVKRGDLEQSVAYLQEKHRLATQDLQTMQQSTDEDIVTFNGQIEAKKAELTEVAATKAALQADCDAIGQEIAGRTASLEALDRQVADKQRETDVNIDQLTTSVDEQRRLIGSAKLHLDNKLDELEETEAKVAEMQKTLVEARKQRQDFLDYEERAKKALETRENALLERERELEMKIATARRRDGVLDKV